MSNMPTLPDADVQEPIPDEKYDDDLVGEPLEDEPPIPPAPDVIDPEPARPL